jgi:hypothetical protein
VGLQLSMIDELANRAAERFCRSDQVDWDLQFDCGFWQSEELGILAAWKERDASRRVFLVVDQVKRSRARAFIALNQSPCTARN